MNVELLNPTLVLGLIARSDPGKPNPGQWRGSAEQVRAHLDEKARYRRALHELHQLEDRELDDLDLARAARSRTGARPRSTGRRAPTWPRTRP